MDHTGLSFFHKRRFFFLVLELVCNSQNQAVVTICTGNFALHVFAVVAFLANHFHTFPYTDMNFLDNSI